MREPNTIFIDASRFAALDTDATVVAVKFNEIGYYPVYTKATALELNDADCTALIINSAVTAAMWGWTSELAKPARDYMLAKMEQR